MFTKIIFRLMLNFKNILIIISISSVLGFIYNFINPDGISLIKTERIIQFEDDVNNNNSEASEISDKLTDEISNEKSINLNNSIADISSDEIVSAFSEPIAIKLARAYDLYNQNVTFIDARTKEEYAEGHIKNSLNIPFYDSDKYENVLKTLDKDKIIVTYCSGEDCDLSIMLGDELFEKGFKRVYIFYGGWNDWLEAGYPIEKSGK